MTPLRWSALVRAVPAIVAMSVSLQGGATDDGARLDALAALLRQGHYEEAEATAAMLATHPWSADANKVRAHQLYVEALLRNGRGAEAKTLKLARELVADSSPSPSGPGAASRFRLLGLAMLEADTTSRPSAISRRHAGWMHGHSDRALRRWRPTSRVWRGACSGSRNRRRSMRLTRRWRFERPVRSRPCRGADPSR